MRKIPLAGTPKWNYFASEEGKIFRDGTKDGKLRELKGTKNNRPPCDKWYLRYGIQMKNGDRRLLYGQRLMGFTYFGLKDNEKETRIMMHKTRDTLNNAKWALGIGSHEENQSSERIIQGTYMNRGPGGKKVHDKPMEEFIPVAAEDIPF